MEMGRSSQETGKDGGFSPVGHADLELAGKAWQAAGRGQAARSRGCVRLGGLGAAGRSLDTDPCPWFVKSSRFCWLLKYHARKEVRARGGSVLGINLHFSNWRWRNCTIYFGVLLSCCFRQ